MTGSRRYVSNRIQPTNLEEPGPMRLALRLGTISESEETDSQMKYSYSLENRKWQKNEASGEELTGRMSDKNSQQVEVIS